MSIAPGAVCEELHQIQRDDGPWWLHISVAAEPAAGAKSSGSPGPPPFPVRAGLGRRIADLIRADIAADAAQKGT